MPDLRRKSRRRSALHPARSPASIPPAVPASGSISSAYQGYRIPPHYDSLIGKLIVYGKTRNECLMRLKRALGEFAIDGIETTIPLFQRLVAERDIVNGDYDIHWLEKYLGMK